MPSYDKTAVATANLPISEMAERLDPKRHRGDKSKFFVAALKMALAAHGKTMSDTDVAERAKNLAYTFTRFASGQDDHLTTGADVTLPDLLMAWSALKNGTLDLGAAAAANGNGSKTEAASSSKTGTETRREEAAKDVPPVSQNVFASANAVFDGLRKADPTFPIPMSAQDGYVLLWDNLAEPVRQARASGVISDALIRLATDDRKTFAEVITMLPSEVQAAIEEEILDRAPDLYNTSLKSTVEHVYHISVGAQHASRMFSAWTTQVEEIIGWMGRDEALDWVPSDEQKAEANRNHAVATFRALALGLRKEIVGNLPVTPAAPALARIPFESIIDRLDPEQIRPVGRAWGAMTPEAQHAFVADLDAEPTTPAPEVEVEAPTTETTAVTDVVPVEAPAPEAPAAPAPKTTRTPKA
jgi:hypothetical protein